MSKRALAVLLIACLFYVGHAYDALPGNWQLVYQVWGGDEVGSVLHVDYDSTTGYYAGYLRVVTDSMAAHGWTVGNAEWWGVTYGGAGTRYDGAVTVHKLRMLTPDTSGYVAVSYSCNLHVVVLPAGEEREGWFHGVVGDTALLVSCNGYLQETWNKVK